MELNAFIISNAVSIPHWSDYNVHLLYISIGAVWVSIPHWSDYNANFFILIKIEPSFQFHIGPITTIDKLGHNSK